MSDSNENGGENKGLVLIRGHNIWFYGELILSVPDENS